MAFDAFMKFGDVDGDSTAAGFEKWIQLESYSWGLSNPTTIGTLGSGAGAGKPVPQDFTVTMPFSSASTELIRKAFSGEATDPVTIALARDVKGSLQTFLQYKLNEVLVSSMQTEGVQAGDDLPSDQATLVFAKLAIEFSPQAPDGSLLPVVSATLDFLKFVSS
jgi:type VI secretion system secreted protein Hcp